MSRDIRSFFISKKVIKPKEEDDDVIPESPDVQIKNKKKESRKRRVLQDDSDEEIFPSKKQAINSDKNKPSLSSKSKLKTPQKNNLKEVKATDLFGGPVKRTEPLVTKAKKKNTEVGIHSDDEFDKSLLELDMINDLEKGEDLNNVNVDTNKTEKVTTNQESHSKTAKKGNEIKIEKLTHNHKNQPNDLNKTNTDKVKDKYSKIKKESLKDEINRKPDDNSDSHDHSPRKEIGDNESHHNKSRKDKTKHERERKNQLTKSSQAKECTTNDCKKIVKANKKKIVNGKDDNKKLNKDESIDETDRKRDFSEFIVDNECDINDSQVNEPPNKKRKMNKSLNESVLTDEERHERRLHSAALYQKYLNRSGPKNLGSKEIPEGSPNCLQGCAFLLTGVLDSFERDEVAAAITKYGGCVKNSISKKVTHVLAGDEAGPAKLAKAQELGVRIINEDDFLKMIKNSLHKTNHHNLEVKREVTSDRKPTEARSNKNDDKVHYRNDKVQSNDRVVVKEENSSKDKNLIHNSDKKGRRENSGNRKEKESEKKASPKDTVKIERKVKSEPDLKPIKIEKDESKNDTKGQGLSPVKTDVTSSLMWVDKYKPQNLKQIIGQHGEASNVKKLCNWLSRWYVNRKAKLPKPSPWAKNDDGGYYKAALLSGPPGVGKTTTVSLVCKELGFDAVELNASDARSKLLIKQQVGGLLTTATLAAYAKGDTGKQAVSKKHVLVMDEVDGMAGNEDRGGLQELIALIKSSAVPIVCMCNERNSPKMRSLLNYCYDLRFSRPRVDQIKSAMLSICYKERVKITPEALGALVAATGQDVRQTLLALSVWAADARAPHDPRAGKKDVKQGAWDAIRKVFSAEEQKTMSLADKSDLFFTDYSLMPLFVQENYLSAVPHCAKKEVLERFSRAADSISAGDVIDARIRGSQAWNLLPYQAMVGCVSPGHQLSGHVGGQIQFPGWLGKNSRRNKMHRLCQEIHAHTRLSTSGSKSSIYLDYAKHLRDAAYGPLVTQRAEGVPRCLAVLEAYHLLREDLDSLTELSLWPGQRHPNVLVDAKVKAAMTRAYNRQASALPYAPGAVRRGRARDDRDLDHDLDGDGDDRDCSDDDHDNEDDDPEKDALIKKKKNNDKASSSKDVASSSKEKAGPSKGKTGAGKERKKKK